VTQSVSVDFLRGIAMRAPGATKTRNFYESNWGLSLVSQQEDRFFLRGTGRESWIYSVRDDETYGIDYINFGLKSAERIESLHRYLASSNVKLSGPPEALKTPGGGYGFTMLDLDGRRLRFCSDVERHQNGDDERALPRKVSHVVLNTPVMDATMEFYRDILGFRVSDYSANQMVFLRCATDLDHSDHHSIALNHGQYASVNHVAFEMPSIDGFMRGIGRMKQAGQHPAWGPGRHGPGNNPFAYFVSPSGFVIEFTSEVYQIDEATHEPKIWPRDVPELMDTWMTAGPPTPAMRTVMAGRPDFGWTTAG